jgi:hypothetical protein
MRAIGPNGARKTNMSTSGVDNKTGEVGTQISLQLISRKGNVVPGRLKERLSVAQTQLRLHFYEREAKIVPPHISVSRIPVNLSGQKFEPVLSKIISSFLCPALLGVIKIGH